MSRIFYKALFLSLNSSPIDELGEGVYESGWWCQVKCEPQAGHTGIHSNPEKNSEEILTKASQEGRKGEGQNAAQMHNL